ncbi:MAG TPA: hypothetical protein VNA69_19035 [Thermoanaerobaculia bacterium]|nr:hypothetical protein [Thermoanaerobaculia bacterium]
MRTIERTLAIATIVAAAITAPVFAQSADISVVKTGPASAVAGADVSYDITVTNNGPDAAVDVTLGDDIPSGMTFVSGGQNSGTPFSCSTPPAGSGGSISCTAVLVPPGTATFTFVFRIPPETPNGTFTNIATIGSTTADPAPGDHSSSVDTLVHGFTDLSVSKSGPAEALADTDVSYSVVVFNLGPNDASSVLLKDFVPVGMDFVSTSQVSGPPFSCAAAPVLGVLECTGASLPAGESAEITFVFHIPAGTPDGTVFTNVATASATNPEANEENDSGSATTQTPPPPQSDMSITKTGPASAAPDTDVTYTIVVTNNGPDDATGVTMTDQLAAFPEVVTFVSLMQSGEPMSCTTPAPGSGGTITCTAATYPAGASTTFTLTAHIPASAEVGDQLTNTANVTATSNDPNEENDGAVATTIVSAVDIEVLKTGSTTADAGTNLTYTITVTNHGPDPAMNVVLEDILPPGTTFVSFSQTNPAAVCSAPPPGANGTFACSLGTLGFGASMQFMLTIEIGNTLSVTNTARAQTDSFDTDASNNESTVITTVTPVADVIVLKSGPATLTAGDDFVYTITVTNDGPSDASTVSLDDTLPANVTVVSASQTSGPAFTCTFPAPGTTGAIDCDIATLAPGATATFTLTVHLAASAASGSMVSNTANVTLATNDPDGGDHTSTSMANVVTSADVAVTKIGPATAAAASSFTYTITLTNNGPSDASTVSLDDTLPANVTVVSASQTSGPVFTCTFPAPGTTGAIDCDIATLAADATATFSVTVMLSPSAPDGSTVSNTANVTTATPDPNGTNNTSTTMATVGADADVSVTKTGPASVLAGNNISYTVTVGNAGPADAVSVTLTDVLPPSTVFVSATQDSGPVFSCATPAAFGTGTITCTIASMPADTSAVFTFVFRVTGGGPIENTATVSSPTDSTPGNGSSTASAAVSHGEAVPALSQLALIAMALSLAVIVMMRLR